MSQDLIERKKMIERACKLIFDEMEDSIHQLRSMDSAQVRDDFTKIHSRLLFLTAVENDFSHLLRKAMEIKHEVETSMYRAKDTLEDAKMEQTQKPSFKSPNSYVSRPETEGKLRSLTFEETYEVSTWEKLNRDVQFLVDTIRSYQQDANRERRTIDTRMKILSLQL